MTEWLLLLLPVAAASGWITARRGDARGRSDKTGCEPGAAYFRGLNFLLNEQPDKAIDVFIQMLEVDSDTVETHLALGNLFRRRGEVDRAIRIHQNLIARSTLSRDQRAQALLELGQDYMRAGLFDRAESLFTELVEMELLQEPALRNLKTIYQQEKDWEQCLSVSRQLEAESGEVLSAERAHYYCELAEQERARRRPEAALAYLRQAQAADPNCVRATLLEGDMEASQGDVRRAIRTYRQVEQQDPAYVAEILPRLADCHRRTGDWAEWLAYLRELFAKRGETASMLALAEAVREEEGTEAAAELVVSSLQSSPSLEGLDRLIALHAEARTEGAELLPTLRRLVHRLLARRPAYQCQRCGFSAKTLHWQCPGCKAWGSVRPASDLHCELH